MTTVKRKDIETKNKKKELIIVGVSLQEKWKPRKMQIKIEISFKHGSKQSHKSISSKVC